MPCRHRPPIPVTLVLPAEPPAQDEIDAILMAADAIVGRAGRAGVALILNGSQSKKALAQGWDQLPDYGRLKHLSGDAIARKVDWCIHHDWLRIEYDRDIPLLVHSPKGWERVKTVWVERVLGWFTEWATEQPERVWPRLEHIHREIKLGALETIVQAQQTALSPVLRAWFPHEVRAVRQAINHTLETLGQPGLPHPPRPKSAER
ncbi:MAG: hypothetical protein JW934_13265 [Anaerolineae bacterium]|nr:hypothetical protein [Anaerolineae bacterium]